MASIVKVDGKPKPWGVRYRDPLKREHKKFFRRKIDAERFRAEVEVAVSNGTWRDPRGEKEAARADAVRLALQGKPASTILPEGPFRLLYRCWGERQRLLYVGITEKGVRRIIGQHAEKGWFEREVIAVTFERIPAAQAAEIERAVITRELPVYNVADHPDRQRKSG